MSVNTLANSTSMIGCCWRPPRCADPSNPSNASTTMVGGKVCFENDNYRITMGDNNEVLIHNKNTGEEYKAWGDPHMMVDGKQAFDFWGTTTLSLDDGTKVTIETTPWAKNPDMTLSSKVTITNGDYGVQVSGIDTNCVGDLKFQEAKGWGGLLDAVVADGNTLHENPCGSGFLGIDRCGNLRRVDQDYIDQTDLKKGGALQSRFEEAFAKMAGLLAVTFVGSFLGALAGRLDRDAGEGDRCRPRRGGGDDDGGSSWVMVMGRTNQNLSWFVAAGGTD